MKKTRFLIVGLILVLLIGSFAASAYAFDFVAWLKNVLGIKEVEEKPTEIFVPIEEIKIEEVNVIEKIVEEEIAEEEVKEEEKVEEEVKAEEKGEVKEEVEEEAEEIPEEKAKVIIVQETDKVSLEISAEDPDKDKLVFKYTSPLNEKGEWQTNYGDAGEYTITITVSDGSLSASEDVLIIVNKKEEAPTIDSFKPESLTLKADENSELEFSVKAYDKNKDDLIYLWKLDAKDVSTTDSFLYKITYDDADSHTVKATISDGKLETTKLWSIEVRNVNRKPALEKIGDIKVKEAEIVEIKPKAEDPDGDEIKYTISEPVGDDGVWETGYDDSGEYKAVVTATDGEFEVSQEVKITVENVNRAPVIKEIIQKR